MTSPFVIPALIFTVIFASMVYIDSGRPGAARFALLIDTLYLKMDALVGSHNGSYGGGSDGDAAGSWDSGCDGGD